MSALLMTPLNKLTQRLSLALFAVLTISIITSLFFKNNWLWLDEVLSYLLISDPSMAHMNDAVVSGMDANPPLFPNLYWIIGHTISLNPQFLRAVSVVLFAVTMTLFYRYTTRLVGNPVTNFILITVIIAFTYLNLTLSTQIRAYALFLLLGFGFFTVLHRLIADPARLPWLVACCVLGFLFAFTHNYGLFYLTASGSFFALLLLWSKQRHYFWVLAAHVLIDVVWLASWYTDFAIQTQAGKPHSWIPLPTFTSFFNIVGEIAPTLSANLERNPRLLFLPILRFVGLIALFAYVAVPRLKAGFASVRQDKAFTFYLLTGWIYFATIGIALVVSFAHTSVFLSRYFWPSHLLIIYQLVYAWYALTERRSIRLPFLSTTWIVRLLPVYVLLLGVFLFYQNRKISVFTGEILPYLPKLNKRYPIFFESANYFLPIWFLDKNLNVRYLLDWDTAIRKGNKLNASVEHKILEAVRENYHVPGILRPQDFNRAATPHFYVIDENERYQIEEFIQRGRVRVIRQLPIGLSGHRILECELGR